MPLGERPRRLQPPFLELQRGGDGCAEEARCPAMTSRRDSFHAVFTGTSIYEGKSSCTKKDSVG